MKETNNKYALTQKRTNDITKYTAKCPLLNIFSSIIIIIFLGKSHKLPHASGYETADIVATYGVFEPCFAH
jgi:hypothetical protein